MSGDFDLIIVGAGPAGLFCAVRAGGTGLRVLVLEKGPAPGRKLLITGSGQCNLTHEGEIPGFFGRYGENGNFLRPALRNFTNSDLMAYFRDQGCPVVGGEDGKVFPASLKAADVLTVLLAGCRQAGAGIRTGEPVTGVARDGDGFLVATSGGQYRAGRLVVSTGGASYPATGSSGDGYRIAESLGQPVTPVGPALAPVYIRDYPFGDLAGTTFRDAGISVFRDGRKVREGAGDLLLTHRGLSGPAILDNSRYIRDGDTVSVRFIGPDPGGAARMLAQLASEGGTRRIGTILREVPVPGRFAERILEIAEVPPGLAGAHLDRKTRARIASLLAAFPCTVERVGGFEEAMVTRGGVALAGIDGKTMESRVVPRLYFIGEVLDIDGDTGGYNLQAAFSTAACAADHIRRRAAGREIRPE